jgi:uncharacterized protein (DUF488 family)
MPVIGLGYEGRTQQDLCELLTENGVTVLCDVRLTPISRKPGLSKTALGHAVRSIGLEYRHLPALGNPKWNRAGFGGDLAALAAARSTFAQILTADPDAGRALAELRELATDHVVALLCFEADESRCHRSVLLDQLPSAAGLSH